MDLIKPKTMPGVMELLPLEQIAFQNMLDTIRRTYERFGFLPVETPVMEYTKVLLTKSGGETERQVYFAQSTGALQQERQPELAMRFDLTVPLARYVAEHERKLIFPFRRYQIQRVYRGESAQRGRFREFYQCDIDVIGKDKLDLYYDAEIPAAIYTLFRELDFGKFTIHMNNRKLLAGFFAHLGIEDAQQQMLVLREVDKLDKRGRGKVVETLLAEPFSLAQDTVDQLMNFVGSGEGRTNRETLAALRELGIEQEQWLVGLNELTQVITQLEQLDVPEDYVNINLAIARGLDYYTGTVYETLLDDHPKLGSVCSGGRYENLAGYYTKSKLPGVGISIGATRLFFQLMDAGLVNLGQNSVKVLVTQMDPSLQEDYLQITAALRAGGINTQLMVEGGKFQKQLKFADRSGIRFTLIMGEKEKAEGYVTVKDLTKGEQLEIPRDQLVARLQALIDG
ncbi:histidine--tRNA ligase [Acanthopleuribacter pedis]|uniref:Histidine--tRNA ligase n=1 Tax=Acanthopleuribacter pedis TaxID=442870 RepID=A0A8J7U2L5_9BACT|nr:histidine--tRNA ligase [Acanthopleuribacter pedis]MBO1317383.1 histidine--tRNA ligase [Acanthopleuribacter pedis]